MPPPEGAEYMDRNHPFVQSLAQWLLEEALAEQQRENRRNLEEMLNQPNRFQESELGFTFALSPSELEWVLQRVRTLRPDAVLIEGPRDATSLIPLLTHRQTRMPVAIYTTYIEHGPEVAGQPASGQHKDLLRHAAYYPLCDYSPELAAIRAAAELGARTRFIDLTFPEMVQNGRRPPLSRPNVRSGQVRGPVPRTWPFGTRLEARRSGGARAR